MTILIAFYDEMVGFVDVVYFNFSKAFDTFT